MFKLRSLLYNMNIDPVISLKLFDQLIKPVILYGSEIWGIDPIRFSMDNHFKFFESTQKFVCEKLNLSFSRFILGVHKKAQSSAVLAELGRYPLAIDIAANVVLYLQHLLEKQPSCLLTDKWYFRSTDLRNYIFTSSNCYNQLNTRCINSLLRKE